MYGTAGDLITAALKMADVVGTGQTPRAEESNDALRLLQAMLAQWARRRWLAWSIADLAIPSTGAPSYPLAVRPARITTAFARLTNPAPSSPIDYPLAVIGSREEYNLIALKSLSSLPATVFLDTAYPTATLYFWPVPTAAMYELHVGFQTALPTVTALAAPLGVPDEYQEAILFNLALRLMVAHGLTPRADLAALARGTMASLRDNNVQMRPLMMPPTLGGSGSSAVYAGLYGGVRL